MAEAPSCRLPAARYSSQKQGGHMRGVSIVVALLGLSVGPAFAQDVDARAALLASLKAMGGENLKTIEISAAGSSSLIGQQYSVEGNWPQFEVADYTRAIDFNARW